MGTIFLNTKTGNIKERTNPGWRPDEDWVSIGLKDHRYKGHGWEAESYYCPHCKKYHAVYSEYAISKQQMKKVELGSILGCKEAEKIVAVGYSFGGQAKHYEVAMKLREKGLLDKWASRLVRIKSKYSRDKVIDMLLNNQDEEAEIYLISRALKP
jgi:hypothetical protein